MELSGILRCLYLFSPTYLGILVPRSRWSKLHLHGSFGAKGNTRANMQQKGDLECRIAKRWKPGTQIADDFAFKRYSLTR